MATLKQIVDCLYPRAYGITSAANDAAVLDLKAMLSFDICAFDSGSILNGWEIPPAFHVDRASIFKDGSLVYDATQSPLGVSSLSESFCGTLQLEDLEKHLVSDTANPEAVPRGFEKLYNKSAPNWSICLPHSIRASLEPGEYHVDLATRFESASMKVLLHTLPGESLDTIIFNAHNCHPFQANDDISGIAVGIEILKRLSSVSNRYFTYQLLIAPEHLGPLFWLDSLSDEEHRRYVGAILLKSVGNDADLRLQRSFNEESIVSRSAMEAFRRRYGNFNSAEFRGLYGNDETVFESPPFRIPSITLTRWPFAGYHTDHDTPDRVVESSLRDTVQTGLNICANAELSASIFNKTSRGLDNLSQFDLYQSHSGITDKGIDFSDEASRWHQLMNTVPLLVGPSFNLFDVAERFDLPAQDIHEYLMRWVSSGLLSHSRRQQSGLQGL